MTTMTNASAAAIAIALFGLSGCSTAPKRVSENGLSHLRNSNSLFDFPDFGNAPNAEPKQASTAINITPFSTFTDDWPVDTASGTEFSDAYTKLVIYSDISAGEGGGASGIMKYESRHWLQRSVSRRDYSINLTAKVTAGAFEATLPLATVSHQSSKEGEEWIRTIHHSKQSFPLFLVPANGGASSPTVRLTVAGDRSYGSNALALAVQVATNIGRISASPSRVITTLSEKSAKDQARALDDAVSKLFGSKLLEEHWSDRDLRNWQTGNGRPRGAKIDFHVPGGSGNWNSSSRLVGTWTVTFDYPQPSVFADWRICAETAAPRCAGTRASAEQRVRKQVNAGQILNFPIASGEQSMSSIRAYLAQRDWFTGAQADLANSGSRSRAASTMCRMIINEITSIGLNGFDAGLVIWAVARGMPMPDANALTTAAECEPHIKAVDASKA